MIPRELFPRIDSILRYHADGSALSRNVKSFSKLSVKLILSGCCTMDYRIEKKDAFKAICKKKHVTQPKGDTATADISAFRDT